MYVLLGSRMEISLFRQICFLCLFLKNKKIKTKTTNKNLWKVFLVEFYTEYGYIILRS